MIDWKLFFGASAIIGCFLLFMKCEHAKCATRKCPTGTRPEFLLRAGCYCVAEFEDAK